MSGTAVWEDITQMDEIKRTTGPQTTNGRRWEVQLSAIPPPRWLELFKVSGESSAKALATESTPRRRKRTGSND